MSRRVLITGSRDWTQAELIAEVIGTLQPGDVVIHGGQRGADQLADRQARVRGIAVFSIEAEWNKLGGQAGPIRNQRLIDEGKPTEAHAFPLPSSRGTWDCVNRCKTAGIPVTVHGR